MRVRCSNLGSDDNFSEFTILLYTFLVISFAQYKEDKDLSNFTFICARGVGNFWRICLGINILSPLRFC